MINTQGNEVLHKFKYFLIVAEKDAGGVLVMSRETQVP
jgi:hypothetical protein